jgi:large subunit ribosomal protein L21
MLAIVETGGKQYQVTEGRYVDVELLDVNVDESLVFDKIVMIVAGDQTQVGQPYVEGATVKAKILSHGKEAKVLVYKQRCKKGYRKKQGHRQNYSRVMVESIEYSGKVAETKAKKTAKPKAEVKEEATAEE